MFFLEYHRCVYELWHDPQPRYWDANFLHFLNHHQYSSQRSQIQRGGPFSTRHFYARIAGSEFSKQNPSVGPGDSELCYQLRSGVRIHNDWVWRRGKVVGATGSRAGIKTRRAKTMKGCSFLSWGVLIHNEFFSFHGSMNGVVVTDVLSAGQSSATRFDSRGQRSTNFGIPDFLLFHNRCVWHGINLILGEQFLH